MNRFVHRVIIFATLLITALLATRSVLAWPQRGERKGSAVISGIVIGPNDRPVAHAAVSYQSSAGSAAHVVHTDARGRFVIPKLVADNYDLRATANGIFSDWEKNFTLHTGQTRTLTLQLIYAKKMPKSSPAVSASNVH